MATHPASSARAAVDDSFEELYRGHRGDVYRAVLRDLGDPHAAEDVTQAAFLDAYRAILRGSQPQSPRAWLLAIAENVRRRRFRSSERRLREEPLDADLPVRAELSHELAHELAAALAQLPDEQRRVFLLREFADLSYEEIAERVDATVGSVQMLLFRARRSLRAQLEPPTVAPRRPGLLVPLPGWLTNLFSRIEVVALAPRAAGAVGAAVVTVGATVAIGGPDAIARPAPVVAPGPVASGPQGASAPSNGSSAVRSPIRAARAATSASGDAPAASAPAVGRRLQPTEAAENSPGSPTTPVASAATPVVSGATPSESPAQAPVAPASDLPPLDLPLPELQTPLEPPALPPLEPPALPPVDVPAPPPVPTVPLVPPLPIVPEVETTGAAGAAGAAAPPLPVPALPPIPLPPA